MERERDRRMEDEPGQQKRTHGKQGRETDRETTEGKERRRQQAGNEEMGRHAARWRAWQRRKPTTG